ncbi:hypothetical protein ACOMHN_063758 [Nucella lapillus]
MDVAEQAIKSNQVADQVGERCLKLFQDFLEEFREGDPKGNPKYPAYIQELVRPERNTLTVSFKDLESFNQQLSTTVLEEYYRVYPFLCRALRNFARDCGQVPANKDFYISFTDVPSQLKVRELTTAKIGTLLRITGQVVRTHPVHPELVSGTFLCLDCRTIIKDVEQQFKYTQPSVCRNPVCSNRSRFMLDVNKSRFVDFQKVRIQETQAELPRGSIPRSLEVILRAEAVEMAQAGDKCDFIGIIIIIIIIICIIIVIIIIISSVEVILRAEAVEMAQAGDKCDFIGSLIVVPDVGSLSVAGARAESSNRVKGGGDGYESEGVRGLKALGVRDLTYRMAFLACTVTSSMSRVRNARSFTRTTSEEMRAFLAIHLYMGVIKLPSYRLYWSTREDLHQRSITKVMSKNRYEELVVNFHLNDSTQNPPRGHPDHNKLYKVMPIISHAKRTFPTLYKPHQNLAVDEAMIKFKGRCSFLQYVPAKPHKWGIKAWALCDSESYYMLDFDVYTGKDMQAPIQQTPLGQRVVETLVQPYYRQYHHVYFDNYFTSVPLVENLLRNETYSCGTIRTNRKGLPQEIKTVKFRQSGQMMKKQKGGMHVVAWCEKKRKVCVLSTANNIDNTEITRPGKRGQPAQTYPKPVAIQQYTDHFNAVDKNDQMRSYYGLPTKPASSGSISSGSLLMSA